MGGSQPSPLTMGKILKLKRTLIQIIQQMIIGAIVGGMLIGYFIGAYLLDKWINRGNDECNRI